MLTQRQSSTKIIKHLMVSLNHVIKNFHNGLSQDSSNRASQWVSIKIHNPIEFMDTVTSCQTLHRNLYLKVSTIYFQKKSLFYHSDSWGMRE